MLKKFVGGVRRSAGGSPDEKIFTPTDERGFFPHTPHPTPHTPHPTPHTLSLGKTSSANPS
ncbi:MAG: hypothetical protein O9332_10925 [Microcystis sp. LE19-10.1B]|uniref:hypothetical protein n=1 Tax=Microcystis sp. LE19-10.1B TaxID=3016428 RepID=UPI000303477D|nr:hypothetical protein [Microcystis sp. LE19-10.1B]MCZ8025912.1 hypothetical protein [Microcystis sp. LE19-10.1B]MCZ8364382.1 hypothetical protein [Microcystis sp. LE19-251.1A]MDJ0605748.1 hypothetical protein [Microcystis sp. M53602_WE12]